MAVRVFEISLEFIVDCREMSMLIYENDMRNIFTPNGQGIACCGTENFITAMVPQSYAFEILEANKAVKGKGKCFHPAHAMAPPVPHAISLYS